MVEIAKSKSDTKFVKNLFTEVNLHIPDIVLDCAYRIGKTKDIVHKYNDQVIVVKFTNFRHRTLFNRIENLKK